MKLRLHVLLALWWVFAVVGLFLVLGGVAASWYAAERGDGVLVNPLGIAVAGTGEIFVLENSEHIRAFSPAGREVRTWRVQVAQGMARMAFGADGSLQVATARSGMHYRFEPTGIIISAEHDPTAYSRLPEESLWRAAGPGGDAFEIRESAVVRTSPTGVETVVVPGPPRFLAFFFSGIPRQLLLIHGGVLVVVGISLLAVRRSIRSEAAGTESSGRRTQQ